MLTYVDEESLGVVSDSALPCGATFGIRPSGLLAERSTHQTKVLTGLKLQSPKWSKLSHELRSTFACQLVAAYYRLVVLEWRYY